MNQRNACASGVSCIVGKGDVDFVGAACIAIFDLRAALESKRAARTCARSSTLP